MSGIVGPRAERLADGVWRVNVALRGGVLSHNGYIVAAGGAYLVVDPGYESGASALLAALPSAPPAAVAALDSGASTLSALAALRRAGFSGEIWADWVDALALAEAGLPGPYRYLHGEGRADGPLGRYGAAGDGVRFFLAGGRLCALHERSACLFTGLAASSMGRDLPASVDGFGRPQAAFSEAFGIAAPTRALALAEGASLVCPRFGSALPASAWASVSAVPASASPGTRQGPSADIQRLLGEIDKLRTDNLDLRSAMVVASDAALRDGLTGLYARPYAEEFIRSLAAQGSSYACAFVELDRLKEINRVAGPQAGDALLADLASALAESAAESGAAAYLFRWSGPVILAALDGGRAEAAALGERFRAAVEAGRRFSRPLTVSVAVACSDELAAGAEPASALYALARARLKLLARKGGNAVLAESGEALAEKSLALVLDGDPIGAAYIVEYFNAREFAAVASSRGGEALELMERYKPELVIADAYLPQYDAFQLRARMLASTDLRGIPFALLAELKTDELVERAQGLGIYHIFQKPVPLRELYGVARYLAAGGADER